MKSNRSNTKKRVLAIVLCMVLMLSSGISTMADGEVAAGTPTPESGASQEPVAASVGGETVEGEHTPAEKSTDTQEETPTESSAAESKDEPTADSNTLSGVTELVGGSGTQDKAPEQGTETNLTEQESEIVSEATELKQEFTDEAGNVTQRVTANIPEGAFQANASEITMEVNYLDKAAENHVKELMTAALPENEILGDYILYDIKFKVNGEVTEPQKAITITFEGSGLHIEDTKKANAFYIDPADPEVQDDKDEIVEITQKSEMIENLQNVGQSVENIDEYDLSEIFVNADGTADKIQMEGRVSTVYGCYVEETLEPIQTLTYEDDDVIVNVNAYTEEAIPAGASLKIVPIQSDDKETEEQYKNVKEQLDKKAEDEKYDIAGFLAYDITFVNESGEEIEPNGYVKVTMEYKEEAIPEEVESFKDENLDVTVMHLEENEKGDVKEVVDMVADTNEEATVETTEDAKVKRAEFVTDCFSAYTITWTRGSGKAKVTAHYGYMDGNDFKEFSDEMIIGISSTFSVGYNEVVDLRDSKHLGTVSGYKLDEIKLNDAGNGINANYLKREANSDWVKHSADNKTYTSWIKLSYDNDSAVGNIYYIFTSTSGGGSGTGVVTEPQPSVAKRAVQVDAVENNYNLELDISSSIGSKLNKVKMDVLLVMDRSGSMTNTPTNETADAAKLSKMKLAKRAAIELIDNLAGNDNLDVHYSLVSFSGTFKQEEYGNNDNASIDQIWTDNSSVMETAIDALDAKGGTNYQAAFNKMNTVLGSEKTRNDARQVVIFLTDGEPTVYNGGGYNSGSITNYWDVEYARQELSKMPRAEDFYSIGFGSAFDDSQGTGYAVLKSLTEGGSLWVEDSRINCTGAPVSSVKKMYNASDSDALFSVFEKITSSITKIAAKNVTVTDTLSNYIDTKDTTTYQLKITRKESSNTDTLVVETSKEKWAQNRIISSLSGTPAYKKEIDETTEDHTPLKLSKLAGIKFTFNGKTITCTYPSDYELSPDYTYTLVINDVDVSNKAVAEYKEKGYSINGDAETGTFAEQPGFYSNVNADAVMQYTVNNLSKSINFPKPVVQVKRDISEELTYDKTAEIADYNNRTYNITLSASSTVTNTTKAEPVDVIMVLDRSGSMLFPSSLKQVASNKTITTNRTTGLNSLDGNGPYYAISDPKGTATVYKLHKVNNVWYYVDASYSTNGTVVPNQAFKLRSEDTSVYYTIYEADDPNRRLEYLQSAVNSFVSQLGEYSPESRVGVVQFCAEANNLTNGFVALDASGVASITNAVSNISTAGGTRQDLGLKYANEMLSDSSSGREKIVILVTDGAPNPYSADVIGKVKSQASTIRNKATLMTVGLSLGDVENARSLLEEIASAQEDGIKYAFDAENGASLEGVLDTMFKTITNSIPVTGAIVKDYINDSFYLLNSDGSPAKEGDKINGGTVHFDENGCYIEWANQTIAGKSISGAAGWTKTLTVKAKEDFMGGNVITTNKSGSGITVEDESLSFPEPSVNVKLLDLNEINKEKTVFIGETISVNDIKNMARELASDIKIKEIVGEDGNTVTNKNPAKEIAIPADCQLTENDISALLNGETVNKTYSYSGATNVGTFTYEFVPIEDKGSLSEHVMTEAGEHVEEYVLKVIYTPNETGECSHNGEKGPGEQITIGIEKNNAYYINVIAGKIQINKTIDKASDHDLTFTFLIEKEGVEDTNWPMKVDITIPAGSTTGSAEVSQLMKGTYKVSEEINDTGYILSGATNVGGNCLTNSEDDGKTVSFTIGKDSSGKDIVPALNIQKGVLGVAGFTNKLGENDEPDKPYIQVEKTFTGLDNPTEQLPDFAIGIYKDEDCTEPVKILKLTDSSGLTISNNGLTFTWKLDEVDAGTYYVEEENESYAGYSVTTTINGQEVPSNAVTKITTVAAEVELKNIKDVMNCNDLQYEVGPNVSFLTTATTDGNYFIWTAKTLSASERQGIVNLLKSDKAFAGKYNSITIDMVQFYSTTQRLENGINYRGNKVRYDEVNGKLIFSQKKQWNYFYYGTYDPGENLNAEITINNAYKGNTVIDLIKYAGSYDGKVLDTAEFEIYRGIKDSSEAITWTPYKLGDADDSYKLTITKADQELKNMPSGCYKLTETKAPNGYMLLKNDIYFKIEAGDVTLVNENGERLETTPTGWKVESVNGTPTIKIINYEIYTLPSTGSTGIYWYLIGGMLLMMAAALILYKNKCREVLKR